MDLTCHYSSPLGEILLAGSGDALTGLWFDGQRPFGAGLETGAGGRLTGYAGGLDRKARLLQLERIGFL